MSILSILNMYYEYSECSEYLKYSEYLKDFEYFEYSEYLKDFEKLNYNSYKKSVSTSCFGLPKRRLARVFLLPRAASNFSMRSEAVSRDGFLAAAAPRQRIAMAATVFILWQRLGSFWGARASARQPQKQIAGGLGSVRGVRAARRV